MNGVIIVDKPAGWTSHDVVNRMRRILGQRSVGHLGTLDPLATGVLPLVTGSLTRLAQFYTSSEKTYEGIIRFGFATNTYDADGEPLDPHVETAALACPEPVGRGCPAPVPDLSLEALQQLATKFQGVIEQIPPPFSAKKINGVPAYKLARKQQEVILKPVQIEIKEFTILSVDAGRAHFRARVSSGTYMRSVAHEMGQRLGPGAHLQSLRRTAVAEFTITQARTLEEVEARIADSKVAQPLATRHSEPVQATANASRTIPPSASQTDPGISEPQAQINPCHSEPGGTPGEEPAVSYTAQEDRESTPGAGAKSFESLFIHPRQLLPQFPAVTADEPTAARIRNGRPVNLPNVSRARHVKVFAGQTDLIAIATRIAGTLFHPKIVFPPD